MTPQVLRMQATLEPRGPAGAFVLTDEQVAAVGAGKKTFPVQVTINGASLSLGLARGGGENMIGLSRAARAGGGGEMGASYDVEIPLEGGGRGVGAPADLSAALAADPAAQ